MASIAAEAGISKPILYRHFGDKSGLYQAVAERHTRALMDAVRTAFLRPGGEIAEILLAERRLADPVRAHVWAHAAVGMVQAAGEWWLDHPAVPRETVVDGIADLLLDGFVTVGSVLMRHDRQGPPAAGRRSRSGSEVERAAE